MIIPEKMKDETINKLKSLLKYYVVNTFLENGYNVDNKQFNKHRQDEATLILKVIEYVKQDKDVHKDCLETLSVLYKKHHKENEGLWKV